MTPLDSNPHSCTNCHDQQYKIGVDGHFAKARACSCITPCPKCGGKGMVLERRDDAFQAVACACAHLQRRIRLFNEARLPARFADKWVDDLEGRSETQKQVKYLFLRHQDEFKPGQQGFLLWGSPGVGKTHLACGLVGYLTLERGISCKFIEFMQLVFDLKKTYAEGRWESEVVAPLLEVQVLVIDELGKGRNSEWEMAVLDQLISSRYNAGKTLHATTNFRPDAPFRADQGFSMAEAGIQLPTTLKERLGDRIYSRLCEMCRFAELQGEDHRQEGKPLVQTAPKTTGRKPNR